MIAGGQVLAVTAFETDERVGVGSGYKLDGPTSTFGGSATVLVDGVLVVISNKVLVVMAAEADGLGVAEEIHVGSEIVTGERFDQ